MLNLVNFLSFLTFLCCFFDRVHCQNGVPVYVNTTRGQLLGYHFDQGNDTSQAWYGQADLFLGIPFSLPPVGELRYKRPLPITQFPGPSPYNATYYRPACIQPHNETQSEDCLYVNIITPNVSSTTKYPVMIWIHGGGLISFDGHLEIAGIVRNVVSKGVVVASMDYRMGWLGFFTTFTDDFPPNLGMLDQVLALKFLKEEISYFGGDPNRITIFGESAGGHSVSAHTYSPLSQNLFQQAIMESGTVLTCYEDSVGPTNENYEFAQNACNFTQEMWKLGDFTALKECLMKIDVQDGLAAAGKSFPLNAVCWNIVQDNYFLPDIPQNLYKKRPNIPVMIGIVEMNMQDGVRKKNRTFENRCILEMGNVIRDPNLTSYTRENIEARIAQQYRTWLGNHSQTIIKIFEDNYLPPGTADDDHMAWLQFMVDVGTPAFFTWGSLRDIEYYLMNNNPNVYAYEFTMPSRIDDDGNPLPNWHPVVHTCELPYLLNYNSDWNDKDKAMGKLVDEIWVNFVKTGQPTSDSSWKPTTSSNYTALEYWEFNQPSTMRIGFRAKDQIVWNEAIPTVLGDSPPNLPDNYKLCSHGYQSKVKNTTCYEAFGTPLAWDAAQKNCAQNSFGALVSIASAFENSDLLGYVKQTYPSCAGFYIGLFKSQFITNNASWTWANYDPSNYRNWRSGSPNIVPMHNCVFLNVADGTWTNQDCNIPQCYICSY